MYKLKPCPFCNGSAAIRMTGSGHFVECDSCMAKVGSAGYGFDLDDVATAAWNQRVNTAWTDTPGAWTDELIQAMTIFIEYGDNLEWLGDESAEVVMLANVLQMRNDLATQLAAAHQRIAELEQRAVWVPVSGQIQSADGWDDTLTVDGLYLVVNAGSRDNVAIKLPNGCRLMRRRQAQEEVEG